MNQEEHPAALDAHDAAPNRSTASKRIVLVAVVVIFAALIVAKGAADRGSTGGAASAGASITSVHNDALADYDAALRTGKPAYVLFHSLTCQPCVEISAVVDRVLPDYEGRIVFVNAISEDAPAQQLASRFQFQYIPTSFFIGADGSVKDSFTGSMDESQLRRYLDALSVAK